MKAIGQRNKLLIKLKIIFFSIAFSDHLDLYPPELAFFTSP